MTIAAIVGTSLVDEIAERDPDLISAGGSRTWAVCGRNFVVAITELEPGDRLTEHHLPDEYMLLVADDAVVSVEHDGRPPVSVPEPTLVVVPAGTSTVHAAASTTVTRVFTARCDQQMRRAVNHAAGADPRAAPLPEPTETGGDGIRIHRLVALAFRRTLDPNRQEEFLMGPSLRAEDLPPELAGPWNGRHLAGAGSDNLILPRIRLTSPSAPMAVGGASGCRRCRR
ncbi:hypothetical protein GCM10017744_081470 [Streptomyces antimycoticus]|uniref:Cupin 2 conserved barrel domain-containing protein n=1 Tax=Streptomyces antimycoticus TaxID=68175 RepID=A0A4D4K346_9ACTN|nr:hypothetical protein [Streptomyces antimycoticus]GDY41106.1 hypothetical protein SANT12839_019880 [Streptomyces antimycoticus]